MTRLAFKDILLLALVFCALASCAQARVTTVERQEIAVTLSPEHHLLHGKSSITLSTDAGRITFGLAPAAVIEGVTVASKATPFSFSKGTLAVDVPGGSSAPVMVTVDYRVVFDAPVPQHPASDEDPTFGVAAAITAGGIFLGSGAGWYPVPSVSPKRRLVTITTPAGIEAVTSGRRVARETGTAFWRSIWEEDQPIESISLSAGPYRVEEKHDNRVAIYTYLYPENAGFSSRYLSASSKYLRFYAELLGPYPYSKFAVVENFFPTGYGFASYTLLGGAVIRLPFILDTSLPHEIAHNWWGNGVLVDYREGNWSEGLVTYLADYLLKEKKSAEEGREYRLQILTDYASLVKPDHDFPLREFTGRVNPASRAIGYGKSAMLFHMVRSRIGDRAFFQALREVCREKLFETARWSDFARAFSRSAGMDVAPFMEQWLERTGGPHFALADVATRRSGAGWEVSGTVVQTSPFYEVHLPLRLETAGGAVPHTLKVSGKRTPFLVTTAAPPRRILLDPDAEVFRLLKPGEVPPTVNSIKGSENLLVVITKSCQARDETLRLLLESLGQQRSRVVAEGSLNASDLRRHDLLFCGAPQHQEVLSSLPEGMAVSPGRFSLDGITFDNSGDLLFLAMRHPLKEGVVALFLPLSQEAAEQGVLKISHYGKYGYLAFTNGKNTRKGMFPLAGGEGAVDLTGEARP